MDESAGALQRVCTALEVALQERDDERRIRENFGTMIVEIMHAFGTPCRVEQAELPRHVRRLLTACRSLSRRWHEARSQLDDTLADWGAEKASLEMKLAQVQETARWKGDYVKFLQAFDAYAEDPSEDEVGYKWGDMKRTRDQLRKSMEQP